MSALEDAFQNFMALKEVFRAGWLRKGLQDVESVAAHSWGVTLLASALCPDTLDFRKVAEMCLIHDLAESLVGDITPFDGISNTEKHQRERDAMTTLCASLNFGSRWITLFDEYCENKTEISRFVHKMDKLDMYCQAKRYESTHNIDLSEFYLDREKL